MHHWSRCQLHLALLIKSLIKLHQARSCSLARYKTAQRAKIIAGGSSHDATPIYTLEVKALP